VNRRTNRSKQRGAAMAEGAIVLPVLCVFFGVMMYIHNAYLAKATIQADTRFRAFSNAAHACMAGDSGSGDVNGPDPGAIPAEGDAPDKDKSESLKTVWLETQANKSKVAVALGRSRTVTAESHAYCNPVTYSASEVPGAMAGALAKVAGAVAKGLWKVLKFCGHALGYVAQWARGWI
jgi:hypothetical protein